MADYRPEINPTPEQFLNRLYQDSLGTLVFCRAVETGFARLATFDIPSQLREAIAFAADPRNKDCYYKYNLFDGAKLRARGKHTIGKKDELSMLVAFGLDIDVAAKDAKYLDQQKVLFLLRNAMPLYPSAIVGSNGPNFGLHAYYFLHPQSIQGKDHYEFIRQTAARWYREMARMFAPCHIDHTSGPERLLRPPGAHRSRGQIVTVLELSGIRYSLDQFALPSDQLESSCRNEQNENSVILDYLNDIADIHTPEPIMIAAGWSPRRDDPSIWDRPEATSGAPTAQVFASADGRVGVTIKTPGAIKTLATDPITGERITAIVPDTPKWLNLQAFYTFMYQGGLSPDCWQRAAKQARRALPRGTEFDVIEQQGPLLIELGNAIARNENNLAVCFVDEFQSNIRYVPMWKKWVHPGLPWVKI